MPVILLGTFDTKGTEFQFVRELFRQEGIETLCIDAGTQGPPGFVPDISREELFATIRVRPSMLTDRGMAVSKAAEAAVKLIQQLHREGKVQGILGLGGSAGTTIATAAMRVLPYGIPKLMVSTLASGQVSHYVGVRDILMMPAVVDFCGINSFSRTILTQAAYALLGMLRAPETKSNAPGKPIIAASMFGVTTPCVERARKNMEARHYDVLVFHATGTGGLTMEGLIRDGQIAGVLDITTTELADELVGGVLSAGRDRLTAAAIRGIPQVISLGALDMVNFGPPDTVPKKFAGRRFYQHNPNVTLMRTTPEENDQLGKEISEKACAAHGPTAILIPKKGLSAIDREGGPFWWPEANEALFQSLQNWISPNVKLIELDLHINDPEFADIASQTLLEMLPSI